VIELDGKIHLHTKERDAFRDSILTDLGLNVMRINNEELENMEEVLDRIRDEFEL